MREKKLTDLEKGRIANILERTHAGSIHLIGLMIEMNTMNIKPNESSNEYTFYWEYLKPQIESVLFRNPNAFNDKSPRYSVFITEKIRRFTSDVVQGWFIKTFREVSKYLDTMGYCWDACYNHDFDEFVGHITDDIMEMLEEKGMTPYAFGLDPEVFNYDEGWKELNTVE